MDAGTAGEDRDRAGTADSDHEAEEPSGLGWVAEPERRIHRAWLYTAFALSVLAIGAGIVWVTAGGTDIAPADPTALSAPVTLAAPSGAATPVRGPTPDPSDTAPSGSTAEGGICPGTDATSQDDQAGWQQASATGGGTDGPDGPAGDAVCGGQYVTHDTSTAGGVFYRWTVRVDQPGSCDVAVYVPDVDAANSALVHYAVLDGERVVEGFVVAQAKDHGQWVQAGSYPVTGTALTVRMDNRSTAEGTVVASAVRVSCHA